MTRTAAVRVVPDTERRHRIGVRHALEPGHEASSFQSAVAAMTCLHGTDQASIFMSGAARAASTFADIERALYDDRTVIRQLAMRRTVFAFPREVMPAVLGAPSARVAAQVRTRMGKEIVMAGLAVDGDAWVAEAESQILQEVRRQPATTKTLRSRIPMLEARMEVSPGKPYGGTFPIAPRVLTVCAADGSIVRGAQESGWKICRPFWTATEQWLGAPITPLESSLGYAELVRRWLWTFGPGTEEDIVWWFGATKAAIRQALRDVEARPCALEDGRDAWLHPEDTDAVSDPGDWAALLPALDPTTMGWKEREFYLGAHKSALFDSAGNGGPSAWWNGRIVGGWMQDDDGVVEVLPTEDIPPQAQAALAEKAAALTDWLDGDVVRSVYLSPLARQTIAARAGHQTP